MPIFDTWAPFYKEMLTGLSLLFIALHIFITHRKIKINHAIIFLFLVSIIPLIQFKFKLINFFSDAILPFLYISGLLISFLLGLNAGKRKINFYSKWLAIIILLSSFIITSMVYHEWINGKIRPGSFFGQANHLSTFLYFGITAVFYFYEKNLANNKILFITFFILILGLAMASSRMALLACIVLAIYLIWKKNKLNLKISNKLIIICTLTNILCWFLLPLLRKNFLLINQNTDLMEGSSRLTESAEDIRFTLWEKVFNALIEQRFLTGFGWNQISHVQEYALIPLSNQVVSSSHNLFLDLFLWNGVILGALISTSLILYTKKRMPSVNSKEEVFLILFIIPFFLHCLLEYPYSYSYFLLPIGFVFGLLEAKQNSRPTFNINKNLLFFYLLLLSIIFFQVIKDYINFKELSMPEKINRENFKEIQLLDELKNRNLFNDFIPQKNLSEKDLEIYRKAMLKYMDGKAVFLYAITLGLNNKIIESANMLRLAQKLEDENNLFMYQWDHWLEQYPELQAVNSLEN